MNHVSRQHGRRMGEPAPLSDVDCAELAKLAATPDAAPPLDLEAGLRRLQQAADKRPPSRSGRVKLALLAAAALLLATLLGMWLAPAPTLQLAIDGPAEPGVAGMWLQSEGERVLRFSDGSEVRLLPAARLRVGSLDARAPQLVLERGQLHARVEPGSGSRWQIQAGPFSVHVTGTVFEVVWEPDADRFELALFEGSVLLDGPVVGASRQVRAGERLRIAPAAGRLASLPLHAQPAPAGAAPAGAAPHPTGLHPAPRTTPAPVTVSSGGAQAAPMPPSAPALGPALARWRLAAEAGDAERALSLVDAAGVAQVLQQESAAGLLLLGQTARLRGRSDLAAAALGALRQRFPGRSEARTATFLLGKMAFDGGRDEQVVSELSGYLAHDPAGPFALEAQALLMNALTRQGRHSAAKAVAKRLLAAAPNGVHAVRAQQVLAGTSSTEEHHDAAP